MEIYNFKAKIYTLMILGFAFSGCSSEEKSEATRIAKIVVEDGGDVDNPDGGKTPGISKEPAETKPVTALAAFLEYAYPVFEKRCGGCHDTSNSPFIASEDKTKAFEEAFTAGKVSLLFPDKSTVVSKIYPGNHNCWDNNCEANAKEIADAIKNWADATTDDTIENLKKESEKNISKPLKLSDGVDGGFSVLPDGVFAFEAENASSQNITIGGDFVSIDSKNASYGKYLNSAANNNVTYANANDAAAGSVTINFDVPEAGNYTVWARVNAPTENDDSLFISVDNGPFEIWATGVTEEKSFEWVQANEGNGAANLDFDFTAGAHTVTIRQREDGVGLDAVAITNMAEFQGNKVVSRVNLLTYDFTSVLGEDVKFTIEATMLDEYSYKFKNPKIISPNKNIKIKNLKLYVNGSTSPQYATYTEIDRIINKPGGALVSDGEGQTTMIVAVDKGPDEDQFAFQFEVIEVQKE